jgi:hypothetical protein
MTAVLKVIHMLRPLTSSTVTSGWKRMPPFVGPIASVCWARYPKNVVRRPSSRCTGMATSTTRMGSLRNSYTSSPS